MLLLALEQKRFLPLGSDVESSSDFQLIAGSNRDLRARVNEGRFRDDLLARMNLWTFSLPSLRERSEDIEPNLEYELENFARRNGRSVRFSTEAREAYLRFAVSTAALWEGNFRDLSASVTRLATLATSGRITEDAVTAEIARLSRSWRMPESSATLPNGSTPDICSQVLGSQRAGELDRFDRVQLADVLSVCRASRSLSDAGRALFAASRARKSSVNDADRLRKYLARFDLTWEGVRNLADRTEQP